MTRKTASKLIRAAFAVLAAFFIGKLLWQSRAEIASMDRDWNGLLLALSVGCYAFYKLGLASLWHLLTARNGVGIRYSDAVSAYFRSLLGKFIPGKVFMLAARIPAYNRAGKSAAAVSVCFLIENICTLSAAVLLFLFSLLIGKNEALSPYRLYAAALLPLLAVCLHPAVLNSLLKCIGRIIPKADVHVGMRFGEMIATVALFSVNLLFLCAGFCALTGALAPISAEGCVIVSGSYCLASIAGILAFFTPSGLGVREGVLLIGLSLLLPQETAILLAVAARLWQSGCDLLLCAAAYGAEALRKHREQKAVSDIEVQKK